jgi:hypothetical protein
MRRQRNLSPFCICINSFEATMADTINITGKQVTIPERTKIKNYVIECLGLRQDRDHRISIQIVVTKNK